MVRLCRELGTKVHFLAAVKAALFNNGDPQIKLAAETDPVKFPQQLWPLLGHVR